MQGRGTNAQSKLCFEAFRDTRWAPEGAACEASEGQAQQPATVALSTLLPHALGRARARRTCARLRASEGKPNMTMRRSALSCSSQRSKVTSSCCAACSGASSAPGSAPPTACVSAAHCCHVGSSSSAVTCGEGQRPAGGMLQRRGARHRRRRDPGLCDFLAPAGLRGHPPAPPLPRLLKVALVCGQPLGGQLLEYVVQHQVDAALRQLAGPLRNKGARRPNMRLPPGVLAGGEQPVAAWSLHGLQPQQHACAHATKCRLRGVLRRLCAQGSAARARAAVRGSPPARPPPAAWPAGRTAGWARPWGSQSAPPWRTPRRSARGQGRKHIKRREAGPDSDRACLRCCRQACQRVVDISPWRQCGPPHPTDTPTCTAICWSCCSTRSSSRPRRCAFSSSDRELQGPGQGC